MRVRGKTSVAFAAPMVLRAGARGRGDGESARRVRWGTARRRVRTVCGIPPAPHEEQRDAADARREDALTSASAAERERERDAARSRVENVTGTTIAEIDELAEEWIGADLARWEWYERVKARREKMLQAGRVNEEKFGQELQELKRTFMEIDALFGTGMLNERSEISASGWGTVTLITLLYVCAGFWAFELVVRLLTSVTPSFP